MERSVAEVVDRLGSTERATREAAAETLGALIDSGELKRPTTAEVNNHVHTIYSFSPYTPSEAAFMASALIQDAVLRNLQTMAESTQRLSDSLRAAHPEMDWHQLSGFRNVLVHDYLGVELDRVWLAVERDLPRLKRSVAAMLKDLAD